MNRHWINSKDSPTGGGYYFFKSYKIYRAYRQYLQEQIHKFDWEQSFTGQFLSSGFKQTLPFDEELRPTDNWFGCSKYHPDFVLEKDNKMVHLSLQGIGMLYCINEAIEKYPDLVKTCSIKFIHLQINNETIYKDFTGNLPPKELIKDFINQ